MTFQHPTLGEIKIGDKFELWLTGTIGSFQAEVIEFDELRQNTPKLQILGSTVVLKDGDYILRKRI